MKALTRIHQTTTLVGDRAFKEVIELSNKDVREEPDPV